LISRKIKPTRAPSVDKGNAGRASADPHSRRGKSGAAGVLHACKNDDIRACGTVARFGGETCRHRLHLERAVFPRPLGRGPYFRIGSICARRDRASLTTRNWTSCAIGVIAYSGILRDGPKKQNVLIKWEDGHGQSYHCRFRAVAGVVSTGHAGSDASDGQHGRDRPYRVRRRFPARRWTLRAQHRCAPIPAQCPSV
jgi:hypothetical protein